MPIPSFYQEEQENHRVREVTRTIVDVVAALCLAAMVGIFLCGRAQVNGRAMEPLLASGDEVLIDRLTYAFTEPQRLDIVYFETTDSSGNSRRLIRRIIGMPGEHVQIVNGRVKINGENLVLSGGLDRAVLAGLAEHEIILDDDEYFVMGDNRDNSEDSRFESIGNMKRKELTGKVWIRIAPFARFGFLKEETP